MSRKHPIVAAIEERIKSRAADIIQIEEEMHVLNARRDAMYMQQEADASLLRHSTCKKPRTKKEVTKDGVDTGD
jgi:hypothetical protein